MRLFCLSIVFFSLFGCASHFFQPSREIGVTPEFFELNYEKREIEAEDGAVLFAWLLKAENPKATIVYFHGNAGNISHFLPSLFWLPKRGFNVLMTDYRGYGASAGEPTIEGAILDVKAAVLHAAGDENLSSVPIAVFGQSLGGALAITAIAQGGFKGKIAALITEGVFASYEEIAKDVAKRSFITIAAAPFLGNIVPRALDPIQNIAALEGLPIYIIHGDHDPIVPYSHAHKLFDAAKEPKKLKIIFGGRHIDNFARNLQTRDQFAKIIEDGF